MLILCSLVLCSHSQLSLSLSLSLCCPRSGLDEAVDEVSPIVRFSYGGRYNGRRTTLRLWMAVGPREPRARAQIFDEGRSDEAWWSLARHGVAGAERTASTSSNLWRRMKQRGTVRRGTRARDLGFCFSDLPNLPWVWLLSILCYGFAGDGFNCCRWVEIDGIWLFWSLIFGFVQRVSVGCGVGFGLISVGVWLAVGCGVGLGGWHLAVVVPFLVDSGGFGCSFFCCFVLHCSKHKMSNIF